MLSLKYQKIVISYFSRKFNKIRSKSKKSIIFMLSRKSQFFKDRFKSEKFNKFRSKSKKSINFMLSRKKHFSKIALNRVLTLPDYSIWPEILISSGIIDLQNNRVCKQLKHWKFRISVPMFYIAFGHNFRIDGTKKSKKKKRK